MACTSSSTRSQFTAYVVHFLSRHGKQSVFQESLSFVILQGIMDHETHSKRTPGRPHDLQISPRSGPVPGTGCPPLPLWNMSRCSALRRAKSICTSGLFASLRARSAIEHGSLQKRVSFDPGAEWGRSGARHLFHAASSVALVFFGAFVAFGFCVLLITFLITSLFFTYNFYIEISLLMSFL